MSTKQRRLPLGMYKNCTIIFLTEVLVTYFINIWYLKAILNRQINCQEYYTKHQRVNFPSINLLR